MARLTGKKLEWETMKP